MSELRSGFQICGVLAWLCAETQGPFMGNYGSNENHTDQAFLNAEPPVTEPPRFGGYSEKDITPLVSFVHLPTLQTLRSACFPNDTFALRGSYITD